MQQNPNLSQANSSNPLVTEPLWLNFSVFADLLSTNDFSSTRPIILNILHQLHHHTPPDEFDLENPSHHTSTDQAIALLPYLTVALEFDRDYVIANFAQCFVPVYRWLPLILTVCHLPWPEGSLEYAARQKCGEKALILFLHELCGRQDGIEQPFFQVWGLRLAFLAFNVWTSTITPPGLAESLDQKLSMSFLSLLQITAGRNFVPEALRECSTILEGSAGRRIECCIASSIIARLDFYEKQSPVNFEALLTVLQITRHLCVQSESEALTHDVMSHHVIPSFCSIARRLSSPKKPAEIHLRCLEALASLTSVCLPIYYVWTLRVLEDGFLMSIWKSSKLLVRFSSSSIAPFAILGLSELLRTISRALTSRQVLRKVSHFFGNIGGLTTLKQLRDNPLSESWKMLYEALQDRMVVAADFDPMPLRICRKSKCKTPMNLQDKDKKPKICTGCRQSYYCSVKCQKEDWKDHKKVCGDLQRQSDYQHGAATLAVVDITDDNFIRHQMMFDIAERAREISADMRGLGATANLRNPDKGAVLVVTLDYHVIPPTVSVWSANATNSEGWELDVSALRQAANNHGIPVQTITPGMRPIITTVFNIPLHL